MVQQTTVSELAAAGQRPRLRPLTPEWITHEGRPLLLLCDHLCLTDQVVAVPRQAALLLSLFDGERDLAAIRATYLLRSGETVRLADLASLLDQLDETLLLDGPRYAAAYRAAVAAFRAAPARPAVLAQRAYPGEAAALAAQLDAWLEGARERHGPPATTDADIRAVVCPHIDFHRGAAVYADVWLRAAAAVRAADLIVIFGTDHHGHAGSLTLTAQHYATPRGVLATDSQVLAALADALGEDDAFAQELNHRDEHSIELAAVWLQHLLDGRDTPVVPILTGSFHPFTEGSEDADTYEPFQRAVAALTAATVGRRVLYVAAADLAHLGPAFGDPARLTSHDKQVHARLDAALLDAVCTGSPNAFLQPLIAERDARRICGLPPIYLTLRCLGAAAGEVTGYAQCAADATFGSLVSVAGVLLR